MSSPTCTNPKSVYAAIASDIGIAIVKFIVAGMSGSSSMMSEAIHSLVDTTNGFVMLLGIHRSRKPADRRHPFGYGLELYFWNVIVAMVIFAGGGGLSIYQGIHQLQKPAPLESPVWSYLVLGASAVFEGWTCVIAYREFRKQDGERPFLRAVRASKDPTVFTVLIENLAAVAGLGVAALGIFLSHLFHKPMIDALSSMIIGLILCTVAALLARESKGLVTGESAHLEDVESIKRLVEDDPNVEVAGTPLTLQLGPHEILLNLDVQFTPNLSMHEIEATIDRLESAIRAQNPDVKRIFLEAEALSSRRRIKAASLAGDYPVDLVQL